MEREITFRMERSGLIQIGDPVELYESELRTLAGVMYYYTIKDAIAMSNNTPKKLQKLTGIVTNIEEKESIYTVTVLISAD